jgi:hypothetical protein
MKYTGYTIFCILLGLSYDKNEPESRRDYLRYILSPFFKIHHDWEAWTFIFPDLKPVSMEVKDNEYPI